MKSLSSLMLIMLLSFPLYSQSPLKFSGQIRPRVEVDKRNFHLNANPASTIFLRSRLNAAYSPSEDLSVFMQIQDSRFMGQEKNTQTNLGNLDIKEAYFELKSVFKTPIDIKVGRMAVSFGNERLIGAADWGNYGRSFDGIIGKFKNDFIKLDVFAFRESEILLAKDSLDKDVLGLWSEISLNKNHTIQPFFLWNLENYITDHKTLGFNWIVKHGLFRAETEFAYQHNIIDELTGDREAYMGAINVYQKISDLEINAGMDYLSGALLGNHKKGNFNTLYATNHKFYGYMDYFPNASFREGLKDFHLRVIYDYNQKTKLYVGLHRFLTEITRERHGEGILIFSSKDLGWETDMTITHKYNDWVSFQFGAATFIPGEIFRDLYGDDIALWSYLMATVNF